METPVIRRLRTFLRICFGYLTLIFLVASGFTIASLYWMATSNHHYAYTYRGQRNLLVAGTLVALSRLVLLSPVILSLIYGLAWWTLKNGRRSARSWALAASTLTILANAAIGLVLLTFWPPRTMHLEDAGYLLLIALLLAVGIVGLIVFLRSSPASIQADAPRYRIRGDGTSTFLDLLVSALALTGVWGGMILYTRWGHSQHLPFHRNSVYWLWIVLIIFVTIILHEGAHAVVGLALGMKLRAFVIGPFQWRIRDGCWTYRFVPAAFLSFGGSTGIISTGPNQSRWTEIAMIAAGPLSNFFAALIVAVAVVSAKGHRWEHLWQPLAFFALVNLVTFVVNLVPFRPEALYSDGARIFQILSGGPWAELHHVFSMVLSSTVTPLRPRDYDINSIQRAAALFTHGREALLLRLFATSHFLDRDQIPEARAGFAEAISVAEDQNSISPDLLTTFVFNAAYLDRDPITARQFWDLYESTAPTHFSVDYWLARSALHLVENHLRESRDAWKTGDALAQNLPLAGAYDFDRDRYQLLRKLLDTAQISEPDHASSTAPF